MHRFGFVRVGCGTPAVRVGDVGANVQACAELVDRAQSDSCDLLVMPELCITGYTCGDLFQQKSLQDAAREGLLCLAETGGNFQGLVVVGLPMAECGRLYNVAAVLYRGKAIGLVPKTHIPNYKEFYERRWFVPASNDAPDHVRIGAYDVPFGTDLLFAADDFAELKVGIELCEDLWLPIPPSCRQAVAGATLLLNLSASNAGTGKADYRRGLVVNQSGRCIAGYLYSAAGVTESTTDLVFDGHAMIAENGILLAESKRFTREASLLVADVDVERLSADRARMSTFAELPCEVRFRRIGFCLGDTPRTAALRRHVAAHPFVPAEPDRLAERCEEIFATQIAGLAKRLETVRPTSVQIGVSGGLDSTLALLVAAKTADLLGWERKRICGLSLPGFGTSERTRSNAARIIELLGATRDEIDIRPLCLAAFRAIGHRPFGLNLESASVEQFQSRLADLPAERRVDLVFENLQARIRTLLIMSRGFVVSTGDLSELALGWCTYNADHMGMYNPNAGIPKTLVRFLVRWVSDHEFTGPTRDVLHSIVETEISPELLPIHPTDGIQSTQAAIGPYELHDFFLYHVLRFGFPPTKIAFLAGHARFDANYSPQDVRHWLAEFYRRFFASQFKRSCLPDGPKVGSVSLSPRGDWRMPSDAEAAVWLREIAAMDEGNESVHPAEDAAGVRRDIT